MRGVAPPSAMVRAQKVSASTQSPLRTAVRAPKSAAMASDAHPRGACDRLGARRQRDDDAREENEKADAREVDPVFGDLGIERKEIRDGQKGENEPNGTKDPPRAAGAGFQTSRDGGQRSEQAEEWKGIP